MMQFAIPGEPGVWQRPRARGRGGFFTAPEADSYKAKVILYAKQAGVRPIAGLPRDVRAVTTAPRARGEEARAVPAGAATGTLPDEARPLRRRAGPERLRGPAGPAAEPGIPGSDRSSDARRGTSVRA